MILQVVLLMITSSFCVPFGFAESKKSTNKTLPKLNLTKLIKLTKQTKLTNVDAKNEIPTIVGNTLINTNQLKTDGLIAVVDQLNEQEKTIHVRWNGKANSRYQITTEIYNESTNSFTGQFNTFTSYSPEITINWRKIGYKDIDTLRLHLRLKVASLSYNSKTKNRIETNSDYAYFVEQSVTDPIVSLPGVTYFSVSSDLKNDEETLQILKTLLSEVNQMTTILFVEVNENDAYLRFSVDDQCENPAQTSIDKSSDGKQVNHLNIVLNRKITSKENLRSNLMHELLHSMGMQHEPYDIGEKGLTQMSYANPKDWCPVDIEWIHWKYPLNQDK